MTYWATNTATVWEVSKDEYNRPIYLAPRTIAATWKTGGRLQRDDTGQEFVPMSTFWVTESIERDWFIAAGDHVGVTDPLDVKGEKVRKVTRFDLSQFGDPDEYEVATA